MRTASGVVAVWIYAPRLRLQILMNARSYRHRRETENLRPT